MKINLDNLQAKRNSVTAGGTRRRKNIESYKTQARTLNLTNNISFRCKIMIIIQKMPIALSK